MNPISGNATGRSFPRQGSFQSVRWANGTDSPGRGYGAAGSADPMQVTDPSFGQAYVGRC
jgi:hypothetical protein